MSTSTPLPSAGLKLTLEREARPLVAEVREAVFAAADGPDSAAAVLAIAPPLACQRLADLWASAGSVAASVHAGFSLEDRLVLDIVISTFPPNRLPVGCCDLGSLTHDAFTAGAV